MEAPDDDAPQHKPKKVPLAANYSTTLSSAGGNTTAESGKSGLAVQQTIAIEPEMAFGTLAALVQQRVKQSLEFHLGFPVTSVQVLLRHTGMSRGPI